MRTTSPSLEKALCHLRSRVAEQLSAGSARLPTIRALSAQAHVSVVTMWKAVQQLKSERVLRTSHHGGTTVVAAEGRAGDKAVNSSVRLKRSLPREQKWKWVNTALRNDLLRGVYAPGSVLPLPKSLAVRYGCCYRTLRKALEPLSSSGLLFRHKRTYRVSGGGTVGGGSIALVARAGEAGRLAPVTARTQDNYRMLEAACTRAGVRLLTALCDPDEVRFHPRNSPSERILHPGQCDDILGFLVWTTSIQPSNIANLLSRLRVHRRPVALLDEVNRPGETLRSHGRQIHHFTMAVDSSAGEAVARHLLALGHHRIGFVSHQHDQAWSEARLTGLRNLFSQAGLPDAVVPFTCPGASAQASQKELQLPRLRDVLEDLVPKAARMGYQHRAMSPRARQVMLEQTDHLYRVEICHQQLEPVLKETSKHRDLTAWVAVNDLAALECLSFLRSRRIAVPDTVSVVGFDDTYEAFAGRLTSYNFNSVAVIDAMMAHVFGPPRRGSARSRGGPITIEGYITRRDTTARCSSTQDFSGSAIVNKK